ncbi:unnamed protein product [Linum tenue]|uniref:Uncharacterized protein n=1 Tax=Linum tenue TaxID=586396 RepID=A0AAV0IAU2_9ROSI|nr:unnamed protein product [Linum tenue]
MNHNVVDDISALSFINTWAEMTRGVYLATMLIMDRTILKAREPAREFHHTEHDPHPIMITDTKPLQPESPPKLTTNHILKMTPDQLSTLKEKANPRSNQSEVRYSTYEILSAHIWRCVSKARGLTDEQPTKLQIPVDARSRMKPPIPRQYFGNVIVITSAVAVTRELADEPLLQTVGRIRKAISRMDDEYLRSSINYMEDPSNPEGVIEVRPCQSPNLLLVSWMSLPFKGADFGWGSPTLTRKVDAFEGIGHLLPRNADGTVSLAICLEAEAMETFKKLFYETGP